MSREKCKKFENSILAFSHILIYIWLVLYNVMAVILATQATQFIIILVVSLGTSFGLRYALQKRIPKIYNKDGAFVGYVYTMMAVMLFLFANIGLCAGLPNFR